ncbi:glycosyltransferase family 9 protein [Pseudomethylobacillus aquaticus]|nr:glycosyltransferase family 9 protein [Pseudomethylobacillus aquaticus]
MSYQLFLSPPALPATVQRILLITLSNIGDVVLTTPVLQALHIRYPDALIDIVGDARSHQVYQHCPFLGRVLLKNKQTGWRGLLTLLRQLRRVPYDLAVDLRTDGLLYAIRAKVRLGKLSNQASLGMHSVEKHFAALQPLGINDIPHPQVWLTMRHRQHARLLTAPFQGQRLLAIGLGANSSHKIWPVSAYLALVYKLEMHVDAVMLLGSQQERCHADQFRQQCRLPVLDVCGQLDILQSTAMLEHALLFVGNDSGLGHLASAVGTPTFTIFGLGQPARYRPWGELAGWHQSPHGSMEAITPEIIADAMFRHWMRCETGSVKHQGLRQQALV